MTTEKDINEQINKDVQRFHEAAYQGGLPQKFVDYFRKAIMMIPPAAHKIGMDRIKIMTERRIDDIPFLEVGTMINMIISSMPVNLYESLEEYLEINAEFEKIREDYNKAASEFEEKIYKKRAKLMDIAGLSRNTAQLKPLVIGKA